MLSKWDRWNPYSEKKFLELYVSFQQKKKKIKIDYLLSWNDRV